MFDDLITARPPPPNRIRACSDEEEHHLPEGAVMLAFAMHLLNTVPELSEARIHPDGEHGKRFDFQAWLERRGFEKTQQIGSTSYGGRYSASSGRAIVVNPASGRGDVVAKTEGISFLAECKGGIINTRHAGQRSRLRQGLCETIGLSLKCPLVPGQRQFAVVPRTRETEILAQKLAPRARMAGIEIALVDGTGRVLEVIPEA